MSEALPFDDTRQTLPFSPGRCCCCLLWEDHYERGEVGENYTFTGSDWFISGGKLRTETNDSLLHIRHLTLFNSAPLDCRFTLDTDGKVLMQGFFAFAWYEFDGAAGKVRIRYYPDNNIGAECPIGSGPWDIRVCLNYDGIGVGTTLYVNGSAVLGFQPPAATSPCEPSFVLDTGSYCTVDDLFLYRTNNGCPNCAGCSWFPVGNYDQIQITLGNIQSYPPPILPGPLPCPDCAMRNGTFILDRLDIGLDDPCWDLSGAGFGGIGNPCFFGLEGEFGCGVTGMYYIVGQPSGSGKLVWTKWNCEPAPPGFMGDVLDRGGAYPCGSVDTWEGYTWYGFDCMHALPPTTITMQGV